MPDESRPGATRRRTAASAAGMSAATASRMPSATGRGMSSARLGHGWRTGRQAQRESGGAECGRNFRDASFCHG